jgi:hypothetical protein
MRRGERVAKGFLLPGEYRGREVAKDPTSIAVSRQTRLVARVAPIVDRSQTVHRSGQVFMPFPDVVLIEGHATEGMTYRYRANGEFCGDTWDESLEAAKSQATQEYGDALGEWQLVPEDVENAHTFARALARRATGG